MSDDPVKSPNSSTVNANGTIGNEESTENTETESKRKVTFEPLLVGNENPSHEEPVAQPSPSPSRRKEPAKFFAHSLGPAPDKTVLDRPFYLSLFEDREASISSHEAEETMEEFLQFSAELGQAYKRDPSQPALRECFACNEKLQGLLDYRMDEWAPKEPFDVKAVKEQVSDLLQKGVTVANSHSMHPSLAQVGSFVRRGPRSYFWDSKGIFVHIWHSCSQAHLLISHLRYLWQQFHELRIEMLRAPPLTALIYRGALVTVMPAIPIVEATPMEPSTMMLSHFVLMLRTALCLPKDVDLPILRAADGRFYLSGIAGTKRHFFEQAPGDRCPFLRYEAYGHLPVESSSRLTSAVFEKVMQAVVTAAAEKLLAQAPAHQNDSNAMIRHGVCAKTLHEVGANVRLLYRVLDNPALLSFSSDQEESKCVRCCREVIIAEMAFRSVKAIIRAEIIMHQGEEDPIDRVNRFMQHLVQRKREAVWDDQVMVVLRKKFDAPSDFMIPLAPSLIKQMCARFSAVGYEYDQASSRFSRCKSVHVSSTLPRTMRAVTIYFSAPSEKRRTSLSLMSETKTQASSSTTAAAEAEVEMSSSMFLDPSAETFSSNERLMKEFFEEDKESRSCSSSPLSQVNWLTRTIFACIITSSTMLKEFCDQLFQLLQKLGTENSFTYGMGSAFHVAITGLLYESGEEGRELVGNQHHLALKKYVDATDDMWYAGDRLRFKGQLNKDTQSLLESYKYSRKALWVDSTLRGKYYEFLLSVIDNISVRDEPYQFKELAQCAHRHISTVTPHQKLLLVRALRRMTSALTAAEDQKSSAVLKDLAVLSLTLHEQIYGPEAAQTGVAIAHMVDVVYQGYMERTDTKPSGLFRKFHPQAAKMGSLSEAQMLKVLQSPEFLADLGSMIETLLKAGEQTAAERAMHHALAFSGGKPLVQEVKKANTRVQAQAISLITKFFRNAQTTRALERLMSSEVVHRIGIEIVEKDISKRHFCTVISLHESTHRGLLAIDREDESECISAFQEEDFSRCTLRDSQQMEQVELVSTESLNIHELYVAEESNLEKFEREMLELVESEEGNRICRLVLKQRDEFDEKCRNRLAEEEDILRQPISIQEFCEDSLMKFLFLERKERIEIENRRLREFHGMQQSAIAEQHRIISNAIEEDEVFPRKYCDVIMRQHRGRLVVLLDERDDFTLINQLHIEFLERWYRRYYIHLEAAARLQEERISWRDRYEAKRVTRIHESTQENILFRKSRLREAREIAARRERQLAEEEYEELRLSTDLRFAHASKRLTKLITSVGSAPIPAVSASESPSKSPGSTRESIQRRRAMQAEEERRRIAEELEKKQKEHEARLSQERERRRRAKEQHEQRMEAHASKHAQRVKEERQAEVMVREAALREAAEEACSTFFKKEENNRRRLMGLEKREVKSLMERITIEFTRIAAEEVRERVEAKVAAALEEKERKEAERAEAREVQKLQRQQRKERKSMEEVETLWREATAASEADERGSILKQYAEKAAALLAAMEDSAQNSDTNKRATIDHQASQNLRRRIAELRQSEETFRGDVVHAERTERQRQIKHFWQIIGRISAEEASRKSRQEATKAEIRRQQREHDMWIEQEMRSYRRRIGFECKRLRGEEKEHRREIINEFVESRSQMAQEFIAIKHVILPPPAATKTTETVTKKSPRTRPEKRPNNRSASATPVVKDEIPSTIALEAASRRQLCIEEHRQRRAVFASVGNELRRLTREEMIVRVKEKAKEAAADLQRRELKLENWKVGEEQRKALKRRQREVLCSEKEGRLELLGAEKEARESLRFRFDGELSALRRLAKGGSNNPPLPRTSSSSESKYVPREWVTVIESCEQSFRDTLVEDEQRQRRSFVASFEKKLHALQADQDAQHVGRSLHLAGVKRAQHKNVRGALREKKYDEARRVLLCAAESRQRLSLVLEEEGARDLLAGTFRSVFSHFFSFNAQAPKGEQKQQAPVRLPPLRLGKLQQYHS